MTSTKLVILDLWNTLIQVKDGYSPYPRIVRLLNLTSIGDFKKIMRSEWMVNSALDIRGFYNRICMKLGLNSHQATEDMFYNIWIEYLENVELIESSVEVLMELRELDVKVAIVTNSVKPSVDFLIENLGLMSYADSFLSSATYGYLKPDPRIFLVPMKEFKASGKEVIVIGDNLRTDILAGLILGTKTILYDRRFKKTVKSKNIPVNAIVPRLQDINDIIFKDEF